MRRIPFATAIAFAALCASAQAQQAPDAGRVLRDQQAPVLEVPRRSAPDLKIDEPLRPALKPAPGLRLTLRAVHITGNSAFAQSELLPLVEGLVGKDIGFDELQEAVARVTRFYREHGYPVARAYLPVQDIVGGSVEITVLEGRFGKVEFSNASRLADDVVRRHLDRLSGIAISQRELERRLLLLEDLAGPGSARSGLRAGANPGESDLTVSMAATRAMTGSVELDNYGNRFIGATRLTGEARLLSPLGLGDRLDARWTHGFKGLDYGRVGYQVPVGSDGLRIGAAYARTEYQLGGNFSALQASGEANTATLNASYPFVRSVAFNLTGFASYDARDLQDRVASTGTVTDKSSRALALGLSGDVLTENSINAFTLSAASGKLNIETPAALAADAASARSNGRFSKLGYSALRLQSLSESWSLYLSVYGQVAGNNLDSSEKFVLGGANGVRAYPQGEGSGDSGYVATAEIRYSMNTSLGVLQPFAGYDAGMVRINRNPFGAAANKRNLGAYVTGVSLLKAGDYQLKFMLAARGRQPAVSDTDRTSRVWLQLAKYF